MIYIECYIALNKYDDYVLKLKHVTFFYINDVNIFFFFFSNHNQPTLHRLSSTASQLGMKGMFNMCRGTDSNAE